MQCIINMEGKMEGIKVVERRRPHFAEEALSIWVNMAIAISILIPLFDSANQLIFFLSEGAH